MIEELYTEVNHKLVFLINKKAIKMMIEGLKFFSMSLNLFRSNKKAIKMMIEGLNTCVYHQYNYLVSTKKPSK